MTTMLKFLGIGLVLALAGMPRAEVIFSENWDTGTIDTTKWDRLGGAFIFDTGPAAVGINGDYALVQAGNFGYVDGVRLKQSFTRGHNLRCTFKVFRDHQSYPNGYQGIGGPWVKRNTLSGTFPTLEQLEAGILRYVLPQGTVSIAENQPNSFNESTTADAEFVKYFLDAIHKRRAITVRVTLGDVTGARIEWAPDGVSFRTLKTSTGVPCDTIGLPANQTWSAGNRVSADNMVWLFFGAAGDGTNSARCWIDDIVVEKDGQVDPLKVIDESFLQPRGAYYDTTVPDTLDLAERGRLAVRGLTNFLDTAYDHAPYGQAYFNVNPAYMTDINGSPGYPNTGKITEAIIKGRWMSGSTENLTRQKESLLEMIGYEPFGPASPVGLARNMLSIIHLYQQTRHPALRDLIERWNQIEIHGVNDQGSTATYFSGPPDNADSMLGVIGYGWVGFINGTTMRALSVWAHEKGSASSLTLAGKLGRFLLDPTFWTPAQDAKAIPGGAKGHFSGHSHSFTAALMGMIEYAQVTNDAKMLDFVRHSYEYIRTFGLWRMGMFGETSVCSDMVYLAVRLSELGAGNYWDDADRGVRNMLDETQITDGAKLQAAVNQMPANTRVLDTRFETGDNVVQRNVGCFMTDATHPAGLEQQTLLWTIDPNGNIVTALHMVWDRIVQDAGGGTARVNFFLNRASRWLDLDSYLPYEGKVVIRNKTAQRLQIRFPRWVDRTGVTLLVNNQARTFTWLDDLLLLDAITPGDTITLQFPLATTTENFALQWRRNEFWQESTNPGSSWTPSANPQRYTLTLRGNTVIGISPKPTVPYSYYNRSSQASGPAPTRQVTRFVMDALPTDSAVTTWSEFE